MGSVACSACGYVRWSRAARCPSCGAQPSEAVRDRSIELSVGEEAQGTRPTIDALYRVEVAPARTAKRMRWSRKEQERVAEVIVAIAFGVILIWVFDPGIGLPGGSASSSSQVVTPSGTVWSVGAYGQPTIKDFKIGQPGTLEGSYSASGGQVLVVVCYGAGCGQNYSGPSTLIYYENGPSQSGTLNAMLQQVGPYSFVVQPQSEASGPVSVTWVDSLQVVF